MSTPELSPAEREIVARFDAAEPAPESFDPIAVLRRVDALHHDLAGWCAGCDYSWPCETNRAITTAQSGTDR